MSMVLMYSQSMKLCAWCSVELSKRQRTYCSRACQMKGVARSNTCATVASRPCDFCGTVYEYHPEWKQCQNTKYCKRECKDLHQQITYVGEGNPVYGTTWTEEQRLHHEVASKVFWSVQENRERHFKSMQRAAERLGYWPGQGPASWENRRRTYREVYGVKHPWMNQEIRQKCEATSLELYGKHTWEIARAAIKKHDTDIEVRLAQVLVEVGIEFVHPYVVSVGLLCREFDFYVPTQNVLIETDGDYHHGNPALYNQLDEIQQHTRANDALKDAMALEAGMRLLRFWGSEVMDVGFTQRLMEALWARS
jgi:very-short-patch-repair endonuclease